MFEGRISCCYNWSILKNHLFFSWNLSASFCFTFIWLFVFHCSFNTNYFEWSGTCKCCSWVSVQLHFPCNVNEDVFFRRGVVDVLIWIGIIGLKRQNWFLLFLFFSSRKWIIIAINVWWEIWGNIFKFSHSECFQCIFCDRREHWHLLGETDSNLPGLFCRGW